MLFSFLLIAILSLVRLTRAKTTPLESLDEASVQRQKVTEIEFLTHQNCSNVTRDEINVILSYFPNVKVQCLAEQSVLIPTDLRVSENIESNEGAPKTGLFMKKKPFRFNEFKLLSETNSTRTQIPISPCVRTSGVGSGTYEISFSLRLLFLATFQVSRALPFYTTSGQLKGTSEFNSEVSYNVLCAYEDKQVRPVVEVSTVVTREITRVWTVEPNKKQFVTKGNWTKLDRIRVMEDTVMLSCVSEKYQTDICSWNSAEVAAKFTAESVRSMRNLVPFG
ncbi:hypothetical protein OXX80_000226 [Metschnikowia pulcherrima]